MVTDLEGRCIRQAEIIEAATEDLRHRVPSVEAWEESSALYREAAAEIRRLRDVLSRLTSTEAALRRRVRLLEDSLDEHERMEAAHMEYCTCRPPGSAVENGGTR